MTTRQFSIFFLFYILFISCGHRNTNFESNEYVSITDDNSSLPTDGYVQNDTIVIFNLLSKLGFRIDNETKKLSNDGTTFWLVKKYTDVDILTTCIDSVKTKNLTNYWLWNNFEGKDDTVYLNFRLIFIYFRNDSCSSEAKNIIDSLNSLVLSYPLNDEGRKNLTIKEFLNKAPKSFHYINNILFYIQSARSFDHPQMKKYDSLLTRELKNIKNAL